MDPLDWLAEQAVAWVTSLRTVHRPHSQILPPAQRGRLEPFFDVMTLDRARFRVVPIIENPPFLTQAQELGIPPAIDFTQMSGLTLDDTVLLSEHRPVDNFLALLFHELVHIVQYEILGVNEFLRQYVVGFAEGGFDYNAIPLERQAYELQRRFEILPPGMTFSVREDIRMFLGA